MRRYCPLCDAQVDGTTCPEHQVPTVAVSVFDAPIDDDLEGQSFADKYVIKDILGRGGMGRVYRASELHMQRMVALKTLHADRLTERRHVRRFYAEARAASRLTSPHVVRIYDFGVDEKRRVPFIAMELLEGQTLQRAIKAGDGLSVQQTLDVTSQICRALTDAQTSRLVHRDLKPSNVLLVPDPSGGPSFVKVMDFGIAKVLDDTEDSLTETGHAVGTLAYMAPEQILGADVDTRTDLYAVGCLIYAMLTGGPPFAQAERHLLVQHHLHSPPPSLPEYHPDGAPIPETLRRLAGHLLSKQQQSRPARAEHVVQVLDRLRRGDANADKEAGVLLDAELSSPVDPKAATRTSRVNDDLMAPTGTVEVELDRPATTNPGTAKPAQNSPTPATDESTGDMLSEPVLGVDDAAADGNIAAATTSAKWWAAGLAGVAMIAVGAAAGGAFSPSAELLRPTTTSALAPLSSAETPTTLSPALVKDAETDSGEDTDLGRHRHDVLDVGPVADTVGAPDGTERSDSPLADAASETALGDAEPVKVSVPSEPAKPILKKGPKRKKKPKAGTKPKVDAKPPAEPVVTPKKVFKPRMW